LSFKTNWISDDGLSLKISEALSQADEIIKKIYSLGLFDDGVELKLEKIAIHQPDCDGKVINLRYRHIRYGLPLNDDGFFTFTSFDDDQIRYVYFDISFAGDGYPMLIRNNSSSIGSTEKVDKVMSYSEAQKRLANGLAKNLTFTVTEAGLRYTCFTPVTEEIEVYHPMWAFVLYDPTFEKHKYTVEDMNNGIDKANPFQYYDRTMAYVDAINGDLYYYNPTGKVLSVSKME
jgi:hypothetical protein